jgi:hypothetical protein
VQRRFQNVGVLASKLLAFAPAEAAISVERIVRIVGGATTTPAGAETSTASGILGALGALATEGTLSTESNESRPRGGTDSAWHTSGAGRLPLRRRRARIVMTGAAGLAVGAIAVGAWIQRGRFLSPTASSTPLVQSSLAVPPLVVPAVGVVPGAGASTEVSAGGHPLSVAAPERNAVNDSAPERVAPDASPLARAPPNAVPPERSLANAPSEGPADAGPAAPRVSSQSTPPSIRDATPRPKLPIVNKQPLVNQPPKPTNNGKDIF